MIQDIFRAVRDWRTYLVASELIRFIFPVLGSLYCTHGSASEESSLLDCFLHFLFLRDCMDSIDFSFMRFSSFC